MEYGMFTFQTLGLKSQLKCPLLIIIIYYMNLFSLRMISKLLLNLRQNLNLTKHKKRKMNGILIKQNLINLLDRFDCKGESSPSTASECSPSRRRVLEISSFGTTQTNSANNICYLPRPWSIRKTMVFVRMRKCVNMCVLKKKIVCV